MTLDEILNAAYDDQGYQSFRSTPPAAPGSDVVARFTRYANEGLLDILGRPRLFPLRHGSLAFTSVAGQGVYAIAEAFDVIDGVVQQTNDLRLRAMSRDWYRSMDPGERSSGTAYAWIEEGYGPVLTHQSAASAGLWVASTSAADVTQVAHLRGVTPDGYTYKASVTLNGLSRVQMSIFNFSSIQSFYIDSVAAGIVALFDAAVGGTILVGLVNGQTSAQYHRIRLWPTPSAAEPYLVDGQFKVAPLVNPTDVPFQVPELYHHALVDWINFAAYMKNGDTERGQVARAAYERRIGELTNRVEFSADYRPIKGALGPAALRWSNLGAWFPADGWGR